MKFKRCKSVEFWILLITKISLIILLAITVTSCLEQQEEKQNNESEEANIATESAVQQTDPVENATELPQPTGTVSDTVIVPQMTELPPVEDTMIRIQFDGIIFSYSTALIRNVQHERVPVTDIVPNSGDIPQSVLFEFETENSNKTSTLLVRAIREKNGLYYSALSDRQQQQFGELEALLNANLTRQENTKIIQFVNGRGIRTVKVEENDQKYFLQGITNDGRFLVEFTLPVEVNINNAAHFEPTLSQIDTMIQTLFIDGSAETLNVANCVDDAEFVEHITIPDGTIIGRGETFEKTWRIRNTGTCAWTDKYSLAFTGGEPFQLIDATVIEQVLPGEEIDISLTLVAPEEPGPYFGNWQLIGTDQFQRIGQTLYLTINVAEN